MLAPNPDDFKGSNANRMDESLLVKFFYKDREDKAATLQEGRPCFKEVTYIEIRVAGSRDAQACRPASLRDKERFPRHYEAFMKRVELPEEGVLLKQWPQVSRSQVEELAYFNIKTVEQLAAASDTNLTKFHGGVALKHRAAEWLKNSDASKLIAEKEDLQQRLLDMEAKMNEMQAHIENLPQPAPKKARATRKSTPKPKAG